MTQKEKLQHILACFDTHATECVECGFVTAVNLEDEFGDATLSFRFAGVRKPRLCKTGKNILLDIFV